jgi:hypothetical protein
MREIKPKNMKVSPVIKLKILCGRRISISPPNNALNPSTNRKAAIAPKNTEDADPLEDNIMAHICVLSPISARKINANGVNRAVKSAFILIPHATFKLQPH